MVYLYLTLFIILTLAHLNKSFPFSYCQQKVKHYLIANQGTQFATYIIVSGVAVTEITVICISVFSLETVSANNQSYQKPNDFQIH